MNSSAQVSEVAVTALQPLAEMLIETDRQIAKQFSCGREFAAYLGLVPRQYSSGGKPRLGRISKMGNSHLRKLLVFGATAALYSIRKGTSQSALALWARQLLAKKPSRHNGAY